MGVMRCNRTNCENVMCDTYVPNVGYVCNECQKEFKEQNTKEMSYFEFTVKLERFLETERIPYTGGDATAEDFFEQFTT